MLHDFTQDEFDIFIQGGQSNADGTGYGSLKDFIWPSDRVWYFQPNFTICNAEERVRPGEESDQYRRCVGEFSLSFAQEYRNRGLLQDGRNLLVIRSAVGGTSFRAQQWGLQDGLYQNMLKMTQTALALNPKNQVKALLWHQGESDWGTAEAEHFGNLQRLLQDVRRTFGENLPFIAGDLAQEWMDEEPVRREISAAVRRVCETEPRARFVESTGLASNSSEGTRPGDTVHFSRSGLAEFGKRYFQKYLELRDVLE